LGCRLSLHLKWPTFRSVPGSPSDRPAQEVKDPPHTPAGEYVRMQYDTTFEKKKDAVETVVPMLDKDGKWRVSGYFIK
jgi:Protein of unknown function (DUF4019)